MAEVTATALSTAPSSFFVARAPLALVPPSGGSAQRDPQAVAFLNRSLSDVERVRTAPPQSGQSQPVDEGTAFQQMVDSKKALPEKYQQEINQIVEQIRAEAEREDRGIESGYMPEESRRIRDFSSYVTGKIMIYLDRELTKIENNNPDGFKNDPNWQKLNTHFMACKDFVDARHRALKAAKPA